VKEVGPVQPVTAGLQMRASCSILPSSTQSWIARWPGRARRGAALDLGIRSAPPGVNSDARRS
jgi:hypothetical protein